LGRSLKAPLPPKLYEELWERLASTPASTASFDNPDTETTN
jgi:hypothetical protein